MQETYHLLWDKLFDFSQYGIPFSISVFLVAVFPSIIIGVPWFRSVNSIAFTSILVPAGFWMMRYLMIVPVLEDRWQIAPGLLHF